MQCGNKGRGNIVCAIQGQHHFLLILLLADFFLQLARSTEAMLKNSCLQTKNYIVLSFGHDTVPDQNTVPILVISIHITETVLPVYH